MQSDLSQQYLKAMGITAWEQRGTQPHKLQASGDRQAAFPLAHQAEPVSYVDALGEALVSLSQQAAGQLLLVLERPVLQAEGSALLGAMLKAIDIDMAGQSVGYLNADTAQNLQSIAADVSPSMIVVMACHGGALAALDTHRASLHHPGWSTAPVAITIHPQELIDNPADKRPAWEDLKRVKASLFSGG